MTLDIRVPIGLLFTIVGALLASYGWFGDAALHARSLGINMNLWWGLVLLSFGGVMLLLARRARLAKRRQKVPE